MNNGFIKSLFTIATAALLASCSTDIKINADYQDITVVYGVLHQNDDTHYVSIQKAFLGEGNANTFAQVKDSIFYTQDINAYIEELDKGALKRTFSLQKMQVPAGTKDTGAFYNGDQEVFYFVANDLNKNYSYKLTVDIDGKDSLVTAETDLIDQAQFSILDNYFKFPLPQFRPITFYSNNNFNENLKLEYSLPDNADRYDARFTFHYTEEYDDGSKVEKYYNMILPEKIRTSASQKSFSVDINSQDVYALARTAVLKDGDKPGLKQRRVDPEFTLTISMAETELSTYMQVNEPSDGLLIEKPQYTNINNGFGVFSAKYVKVNRYFMEQSTYKYFVGREAQPNYINDYTSDLNFCYDIDKITTGVFGSTLNNLDEAYYCD